MLRSWVRLGVILAVLAPSMLRAQDKKATVYISPRTGALMKVEPPPPPPQGRTTRLLPPALTPKSEEPVPSMPLIPVTLEPEQETVAAPEAPRATPPIQLPAAAAQPVGGAELVNPGAAFMLVPDDWVAPRFSVRRSFGDGVGYDNGYTYLEAFTPFLQEAGSSLFFANNRVVNYDNGSFWEFQTGGGARRLLPDLGVVAGLNAFYDGRNTSYDYFHQLGLGWEALGAVWEWRGNVYIPIGQQRANAGTSGYFNPQFVSTNISLDRFLFFETSMGGVDTEVGRSLIVRDALNLRGYVGCYHYSNDQVQTANGIRGRLEAWVGENLSLNLAVQNDAVFDTTVTGGLALHLGGLPRGLRRVAALESKLGNRVVRDPNIVVQRTQQFRRELAIDPATNAPIEVRHVSSGAGAGGDGSVERPFQTLAQLQTGSGPGQILFVHSGSVFDGQNIVLQNNQRFLGEGIPYTFTATQGTFLLPTATGGHVQPIIQNALLDAITLASNNEVGNFAILSPGRAGIAGTGISNFYIHDNRLANATNQGILLVEATGTGLISNNSFVQNLDEGIRIANAAGQLNLTIQGNTLIDNGFGSIGPGPQIDLFASGTASINTTVANNQVLQGEDDGLRVTAIDNAHVQADIHDNNFDGNCCGGVNLLTQGAGSLDALINDNTFANNQSAGIVARSDDQSSLTLSASNNNFQANFIGVDLQSNDDSNLVARFSNNTFNSDSFLGMLVTAQDQSRMTLGVLNNNFTNDEVDVLAQDTAVLNMALHGNASSVGYFLSTSGAAVFGLERDAAGNFPPTDNAGPLMLSPAPGAFVPLPFGSLFP